MSLRKFSVLALLMLSQFASAREFYDASIQIQMTYSHFDTKTIPVGTIAGHLRRTNDDFGCEVTVNSKTYTCKATTTTDKLTWIKLQIADYREILVGGVDNSVSQPIQERVRALLNQRLTDSLFIVGRSLTFRAQQQAYEDTVPDVVNVNVKIQ